jgi:hypothetical protein
MLEFTNPQLSAWESFYVIVGSSGAALIGLQFVVITLIAGMRKDATADEIRAFGTPTVVHLAGALLVAAIMSVPSPSLFPTSVALAACGLGGLAYSAMVIRRARRQAGYKPVWEDWLWHAILPCKAYALLTLAALFLRAITELALFVVGGAALGLLLIAIHNAWDTVTYIVVTSSRGDATKAQGATGAASPSSGGS